MTFLVDIDLPKFRSVRAAGSLFQARHNLGILHCLLPGRSACTTRPRWLSMFPDNVVCLKDEATVVLEHRLQVQHMQLRVIKIADPAVVPWVFVCC